MVDKNYSAKPVYKGDRASEVELRDGYQGKPKLELVKDEPKKQIPKWLQMMYDNQSGYNEDCGFL